MVKQLISLVAILFTIMMLSCGNHSSISDLSCQRSTSAGYCVLPDKDINYKIVQIARGMLDNPLGSCTPFTLNGKDYQGCVEYHWDAVRGKHIGVTVYRKCSQGD
jgi:hypothetical protein